MSEEKTINYDERQDFVDAGNFFNSVRGRYIFGQALMVAIEAMESVPSPHTEVSNIEDMKLLLNLVPFAVGTPEGKKAVIVECAPDGYSKEDGV